MFMSALFTNIQFSEAWVLSTKVLPNFLTPALLCGSGKEAMVFTLYMALNSMDYSFIYNLCCTTEKLLLLR